MENQHSLIKGYRELSQEEIDLMNKVKAHAEATKALFGEVSAHIHDQINKANNMHEDAEREAEVRRLADADPTRWLQLGSIDLQVGFMKVVRAVAQPTTF